MRPMLSFIIPVYNGEKYLAEAIYSLLQQPCQDMEVIIVDDGSTDSSGSIADAIAAENRNIRVCHIPNRGVSAARNVGIQLASGRYIGFLDADDLLCKDAYTWEIHEILAAAQYDILSFSYLLAMDDLRFGRMIQVNTPGLFERDHPQYHLQTQKHFCSFLYRRELFTNVIRFPDGIRYFEDVGFLFLISRNAENIMQYEKAWFLHRMNYTSVIHSINDADYILEVLEMWNWCRHNSILPDDIHTCDGNIFSLMAEYIRTSSQYGTPLEVIQNNVQSNKPFQYVMDHYGTFEGNTQSAQLYTEFLRSPKAVWRRFRIKGVFYIAMKKLSRTKAGTIVNRILRYNLPLTEYVVDR